MRITMSVGIAAVVLVASCKKAPEPITGQHDNNSEKRLEMLEFASDQAMNEHLETLFENWAAMDHKAAEDFYGRIGEGRPAEEGSTPKMSASDRESLRMYHKQRLENINALRMKNRFVSLQSVVDELNSLSYVDADKASTLAQEHGELIYETEMGYATVIDPLSASVLNTEGMINVSGQIYKYEAEVVKIILDGDPEKIADLPAVQSTSEELRIEVRPNTYMQERQSGQRSIYIDVQQGILPGVWNPDYVITYHTGITTGNQAFVQLGSYFLNQQTGQYVLIPSQTLNINSGTVMKTFGNPCGWINGNYNKPGSGTINTQFGPVRSYCSNSRVRELNLNWSSSIVIGGITYANSGMNFFQTW